MALDSSYIWFLTQDIIYFLSCNLPKENVFLLNIHTVQSYMIKHFTELFLQHVQRNCVQTNQNVPPATLVISKPVL